LKIHILYSFVDDAWGGGNQFLKAIREYFISLDIYEEDPESADIIIFNSHHNLGKVAKLKLFNPSKIFVHRVDGPIFFIRDKDLSVDKKIFQFNNMVADATVFQSSYSRKACFQLGMINNAFEKTIINAPNPLVFNKENKNAFSRNRKTRLVATSWSKNMNKGFGTYRWLDENLDFDKYEMKFIGNTPLSFRNISYIPALSSEKLSAELKRCDIFITASINDPCSNSLIEALHCGLPAIALNGGGHPEIIGNGGLLFNDCQDLPILLGKMVDNYNYYFDNIKLMKINQVGSMYLELCKEVYDSKEYVPKELSFLKYFNEVIWIFSKKISEMLTSKYKQL